MRDITRHTDYWQAIAAIKLRIRTSQARAVLAVTAKLLGLYWDISRYWKHGNASAPGVRRWLSRWRTTCRPATRA
ncbi:hypothetical protein [Variovorax sp. dw_308]|uniref:hypothetical protein n=1 Tax=Variovorax sp. dw_308 TaxID=2721546 RepID=UPI001C47310E|nr:hypothetical protein [Variovorax sp. dw_308]